MARLRKFVKPWVDLFAKHAILDHARSAMAFQALKGLVLREDTSAGRRGMLETLGIAR